MQLYGEVHLPFLSRWLPYFFLSYVTQLNQRKYTTKYDNMNRCVFPLNHLNVQSTACVFQDRQVYDVSDS